MSRQRIKERIAKMSVAELNDLADALGVNVANTDALVDAWLTLAN